MSDRVLALQGIHNFRDYGGYSTSNGSQLKRGILWRSAQHGDACAADLDQVHALGIRTVIDLRGDSERVAKPCLRHDDFTGEILHVDGETAALALHRHASAAVLTVHDAFDAMIKLYEGLPYRHNLVSALKLYFGALAERPGPSLLHCVAGKDRTGFAAALLHHLLGVHPDDALADYLLTNEASDLDRRLAEGKLAVHGHPGQRVDEDAVRVLWSVDAAFLNAAFESIQARYASVSDYAREVLDVDAARLAAIEANVLD